MGRRGRGGRAIEELPNVLFEADGIRVQTYSWSLDKSSEGHTIHTILRIAGWQRGEEGWGGNGWTLKIVQPLNRNHRRGSARIAYLRTLVPRRLGPDVLEFKLMSFTASNWREAIFTVKNFAADRVIDAMRKAGAEIYGTGGVGWNQFRPFVVVYPWADPQEPNAKYSPFKLCKGVTFDAETDGVVASVFDLSGSGFRNAANKIEANAYLQGPNDQGLYFLYHRDGMATPDEIDIDEWRARIIAGTEN